uniref:phage integrase family protein n=1 Tax=Caldimonas tepidiphila TaxID=2315841 RepID=UPI002350E0F9
MSAVPPTVAAPQAPASPEPPAPPSPASTVSPADVVPRRRGRPPGAKTAIAATQALRLHHFHFVRAALELPLRSAWQRYLAFAGGPDDERHFRSQLRELSRRIRQAAGSRGMARLAEVGLHGHAALLEPRVLASAPSPAPAAAAIPSLDAWIAERCEQLGVDMDFQSQAEWLAEYEEEFALDRKAGPLAATALPAPSPEPGVGPTLKEQLRALHQLATELARPPALDDALAGWLAPALCKALQRCGVLTLGNLVDYANLNHHRWYERVPGLGRERAARLIEWLAPLAAEL